MSTNPYESPDSSDRSVGRSRSNTSAAVLNTLLVGVVGLLLLALFSPVFRFPVGRESARRAQCTNNLKQIGLALLNYEGTYKSFPPAYTQDENGKRLHSWRTMILPYMEQGALHKQVNFNMPWDDPSNEAVRKTVMPPLCCPSIDEDLGNKTTYVAVLAPEGAFTGEKGRLKSEIDDMSMTVLIVEVDAKHAVEWMSPEDIDLDSLLNLEKAEVLPHDGGINVLFGDGRAKLLDVNGDKAKIRALITVSSADNAGLDEP